MLLDTHFPLAFILKKFRAELIFISLYATAVSILDEYKIADVSIPIALPTIVGTAISLLLAFRTNQAYERWWEARIVWGAIVNDSRTLVRQTLLFARDTSQNSGATQDLIKQMGYRQIGFCYALGQSLRDKDAYAAAENFLDMDEQSFVKGHTNVPNALLLLHNKTLRALFYSHKINAYQQMQLDTTLVHLCNSMGQCERIKNTVFPTMYSLIVRLFLYLFTLLLPFGLANYFSILEVPIVVVVASLFFLIEKSSLYLQKPFDDKPTDTPVTDIAATIETNLKEMLAETGLPAKVASEGYYVM
jgi:putative membrane protein